ncbi:MAG: cation transporter [Rickettsiales bacterium]|nr:cation transporter [Rickettsiales bacterium]
MELENKRVSKLLKLPVYFTVILIVAKFLVYLKSGSIAIFSLFTDSFFDFIGSAMSLVAYRYSIREKTEKYQYGFYGIIDVVTILISVFIMITVFFIYYEALYNIITKRQLVYDGYAIFVMFISTIISFLLSFILQIAYDKTKLLIIKTEIAHYRADAFTNGGVLVSILICRFVYNSFLIDPVIAMIMGYYVAKPAFEVFFDAMNNILSKEIDDEIKNKIVKVIEKNKNIVGYHNFKTRKSGERIFIQLYLEINKDLSFALAHEIVENTENIVENLIENCEIIIHACPR